MTFAPTPVLLGGIDVFHLMNDRAMRARGLAGNHCLFVIALDGRIDVAALQARLDRAVRAMPELCFRLDERPLRLGRPRWVADTGRSAPAAALHEIEDDAALAARIEAFLDVRVGGEHPWALDVLRRPHGGDVLVFRHFHALVDGKGVDRLVAWLGSGGARGPEEPPPPEERFESAERPLAGLDRDARLALARAYKAHTLAMGRTPILSLATATGACGPPRVARMELSADETRAFDRRVRERAKLAESSLMLLASVRLADRALVRLGFAPPQHVVPVPLSLDPKVGARRLLGNNLTMILLSLRREELDDEPRAIARLAEQQRAAVRERLDVAMLAALDVARWLPGPAYRWLGAQAFRGELSSLVFSNPGAVTISTFAGLPVVSAYPLPTVVSPPGFQVIFSRYGGLLGASIVHTAGALGDDQAAAMPEALRAELCGATAARTV